jgi:dihydrofolate reductase
MRRLLVFESLSVDGYFADANSDMRFAKNVAGDPEFDSVVAQNAGGEGVMLFGRVTYEMMASFWPTPMAAQMMPEVAEGMNRRPKIVFSKTLREAAWNNTTLVSTDALAYVRALKEQPGPDIVVLGSGTIVTQLAAAGLVDEFQFVIVPVVLGHGRPLFATVQQPFPLKLRSARSFANGNLYLTYEGVPTHAADHSVSVV